MREMIDVGQRMLHRPPPGHQLMIAADGVKPRAFQPGQHLGGFRPAVHQISDCEQPVALGREPDGGKCGFEPAEMAMDVAHGEIAAGGVEGKALDSGAGGHRPGFPGLLAETAIGKRDSGSRCVPVTVPAKPAPISSARPRLRAAGALRW